MTDDAGRGDLGDFQYFIFNLVALAYFFSDLFAGDPDVLPTIPDTLVALTGASAFAYLSKKGIASDVPSLTGVYPATAPRGDAVTRRGANLVTASSPPATAEDRSRGPKVLFGGIEGTQVDANDASAVKASVPDAAQVGQTEVRAVTSAGTQTPLLPFQVSLGPAQILAVRPAKVVLGTDSELAVDGLRFGEDRGSILLDGRSLTVKTWSDNRVIAELPAALAGFSVGARLLRVVDSKGRPSGDLSVEIA